MPIKISSINVNNNPSKSLVRAKKIESADKKLGHLLSLVEINKVDSNSDKIIELINRSLKENYFENDKMILSDSLNSLKIEAFFESALVKTAKDLFLYLDKEKINLNLDYLNISTVLIYEGEIYLSNFGKNKAYLIRKVKSDYEISDIDSEEEQYYQEKNKIFSSIINGEIPNNSYIIISNPSLAEYILNKDFIDIIEKLNIEGAIEKIKTNLKEINNYSNFCGLILKNSILEEKMNNSYLVDKKNEQAYSNKQLENSENETQKLLNKTGSLDKKRINKVFKIFVSNITIFKKISKLLKKREKQTESIVSPEILNNKESKVRSKKLLIFLIIILTLSLLGRFYLVKNKKEKIEEKEYINQTEESIKQKGGQVDSYLLYGDENNALILIQEMQNEIKSLNDKERDKMKDLNEIEQKIEEQLNQIRKMIKIEQPKELSNLLVLNNEAHSSSMSISNNTIYVADAKNGLIYSVKTDDGLSSELSKSEFIKSEKILSNSDRAGNSYFLNDKYFININSEGKINYTKINYENSLNISSFDFFNNKPYLLDNEKGQIFTYTKNNNMYTDPTPWIKDDNVKNPVYIAIDHYIYILDNNGSLFKYLSGNKQSFDLGIVDPEIKNPDLVRLGEKYLYVVEYLMNRVVIFNKNDGAFINQYSSDKFDNLKDLAINEDENKMYLLNSNLIYEIDI